MIAVVPSATLTGAVGRSVSVEVHVSNGLPAFTVVGLPDAAVRESATGFRAALLSSGLVWPLRRVTVNLAPSGVRKGGAGLDLPIAIGLLVASGELPPDAVSGWRSSVSWGSTGPSDMCPGWSPWLIALPDPPWSFQRPMVQRRWPCAPGPSGLLARCAKSSKR